MSLNLLQFFKRLCRPDRQVTNLYTIRQITQLYGLRAYCTIQTYSQDFCISKQELKFNMTGNIHSTNLRNGKLKVKLLGSLSPTSLLAVTVN